MNLYSQHRKYTLDLQILLGISRYFSRNISVNLYAMIGGCHTTHWQRNCSPDTQLIHSYLHQVPLAEDPPQ